MVNLGALFRLMRPVNCAMMGFAIVVGAAIGGGWELFGSPPSLAYAFVTGFALTGSAMAINDYHDREIDAINEPQRPIPSGEVSPGEALAESVVLGVVGLAASWLTGLNSLLLAVLGWGISIAYATFGKKTGLPGNLMVSSCIALPFVYGGVIAGGLTMQSSLMFTLVAFLTNTGREITKSIVDVEGDRAEGVRTVAVSRGERAAALFSAALYLAAAIISVVPYYLDAVSIWYVPFVGVTDVGLIYLSYLLVKDSSRENSRRVKNWVRTLMMSGLVGFLLGNLM